MDLLPQWVRVSVPEPDQLTRPAPLADGALRNNKLALEPVTTDHWQHIFAVLREKNVQYCEKIVRKVRSCGLSDDALEQLAWDKREDWEAAGYAEPAAGRRFHDTVASLAAGDLVFEQGGLLR